MQRLVLKVDVEHDLVTDGNWVIDSNWVIDGNWITDGNWAPENNCFYFTSSFVMNGF